MLDASASSLALDPPAIGFGWSAEETAFLVGLHDIGKADSCFQHQKWVDTYGKDCGFTDELKRAGFPVAGDARCRHERISAKFINKLIKERVGSFTADAISRSVVVHHGHWIETARDIAPVYAKAQDQLCQMLQRVLGVKVLPSKSPSDLSAFGMRLAGHIVLCDWIASNEKFFGDERLKGINEPEAYFARARESGASG